MALPQTGLEAVIAGLSSFEAGAKTITKAYDSIEAKAGNVEKATGNMGSAFSSLSSGLSGLGGQFVGLGQGVLKFGAIAGGAALAGTVALTAGVVALGASALGEVAKFERMNLSIQNLVAREISGGKVIEQATQTRIQLTKKESEELDKLKGSQDNEANSRDVLTARIQEQKEKIRQLTEQYGSNGLVVIKERAELQGMELDLNDLNKNIDEHKARIVELESKNGQLVSTLQKVRVGQVSMSEAMKEAAPRTKELIKWIQMLAIQSPFTSEGIQNAFQTALAYGFTSEQAQRLTEAEIDFISATGRSAESADLIALALGQVQARGKLSAQELRQLSEQGVGVNKILEDMGFTLDDVSNGLVPVDKFIEAVIKDMEVFKGSAKAQATTFSGLISSLEEIKSVGLREFFTGTFQAIQPYLASFVDFLTNAALQTGGIRALGDVLGNYVATALKDIGTVIATFRAGGLAVFSKYLGVEGIPLWYELQKLLKNITKTIGRLSKTMTGPLASAFSYISDNIIPAITRAIVFVNEHFDEFKGAIVGVGAVLATGVFAAIIAGILSLLTPINLIIGAAALLGAAWAGDWYGIQEIVKGVIDYITNLITTFQAGGLFGSRSGSFGSVGVLAFLGIPPNIIDIIQATFDEITTLVNSFMAGGIFGKLVNTPAGTAQTGGILRALGFSDETVTKIQDIIQQVINAVGNLTTWWTTNWPKMEAVALTSWVVIQSIWAGLVAAVQPIIESISQLGVTFSSFGISWQSIGQALLQATGIVFAAIGVILLGLVSGVIGVVSGIAAGVTQIIQMWSDLSVASQTFVTGILQLFSGDFSNGLSNIWTGIWTTAYAIFNGGIKTVMAIFQGFFKSVIGFWTGFYDTLVGHSIVPDLVDGIIRVFKDAEWIKVGEGIISGILKGLKDNVTTVYEYIKSLAGDVIQQALASFGVHSPSTVFMEIGKNLMQGLAVGISDNANLATQAINQVTDSIGVGFGKDKIDQLLGVKRGIASTRNVIGSAADDVEKLLDKRLSGSKGKFALTALKDVFKANSEKILGAADPKAMFLQLARQNVNFEKAGISGTQANAIPEAISLFIKQFYVRKKELEKAQQEIFIQAGRTALTIGNQLNDIVKSSADILNQRVETLQQLVGSGAESVNFEGQIISQTQAQEKLNQALEEQKRIQSQILIEQQNEMKLNFLQKQLDLVETISQAGLNVDDILGGLTLGLNASIPDMIEATNRLVTAMINQVDQDLQIHSPSKVMAEKGRMTGQGFVQGILGQIPNIAGAMAAAINGPSMAGPAYAGAGGGGTVNNFYTGGNNINNGMDEATFESRVIGVIRRQLR